MERWVGRVALVTGASSGIGAAISEVLVENGMIVVGCGRNVAEITAIAEKLSTAPGKLHPYKCDLTKEDEIEAMFDWIKSNLGGVDVCVNNAGFGHLCTLLEGTVDQWRRMLDVNVVALCLCTKLAFQSMQARNVDDGQIIMLNSMSGHRIPLGRTNHFYSATKFAVTSITEGLRQELRELNTHIRVAAISPGYVETGFISAASNGDPEAIKVYKTMKCIQPREIADAVVYILGAPAHVQIHDILMRPTEQKF